MTEEEYEADLERRRVAFEPWLPKTGRMLTEQKAIQKVLKRRCGARFGKDCYVAPNAHVATARLTLGDGSFVAGGAILRGDLTIGADSSINPYAHIAGLVRIGAGVRIAPGVGIFGFNHGIDRSDIPIKDQPHSVEGIEIGDGTWIGANAVIVDGVTLGPHCIVAAGAVVTKSFPGFQLIAGNPARALRDRRNEGLVPALTAFGEKVRAQIPGLVAARSRQEGDSVWFVDGTERERRVRPWCDAVELCAMTGQEPPLLTRPQWIEALRSFQAPQSGLVADRIASDPAYRPPTAQQPLYDSMITVYALECLDAKPVRPIGGWCDLSAEALLEKLPLLRWADDAWGAGDWVDSYASCLHANETHFGQETAIETLFAWLDMACSPVSGLWGASASDSGWLLPVNGFYRLTRGTYAQYGRPLPHPAAAIDTILTHSLDPRYFGKRKGNACNVLDVVHPLWLCLKQTEHRRREAENWVRQRLLPLLESWVDGQGFAFDLDAGRPGLQGTEMWLSITYLMADLIGLSDRLGFVPRGVHRPDPALPGAALTAHGATRPAVPKWREGIQRDS